MARIPIELTSTEPTSTERILLRWVPRAVFAHDAAGHLYAIVHPRGTATSAVWVVVICGFVVADLVWSKVLERTGRRLIAARFAWTVLDVAACAAGAGPGAVFVPSGVPLALDLGIRRSRLTLAVPAAVLLGGVLTTADGFDAVLGGLPFSVIAVGMGLALGRYGRRRERAVSDEAARQLDAVITAAELEGQNETMIANGSAADLVQSTGVLLELAVPGSTLRSSAAQAKADLAETTRSRAAYLGDVLLSWQQRHNDVADLREVVEIHLAPEHLSAVLTATQAADLRARLDAAELRGSIGAELLARGGPEVDRTLRLGHLDLSIERAGHTGLWLISPLAVMVMTMGYWLPLPVLTGDMHPLIGAAWWATATALAVIGGRRIARNPRMIPAFWSAIVALLTLYTVVTAVLSPGYSSTGVQLFPGLAPMEFLVLAGVLAWPIVSRSFRWAMLGSTAALWALNVGVAHRPVQWRTFAAESLFLLGVAYIAWGSGQLFASLAARLEAARVADAERFGAEAHNRGQALARSALERLVADARILRNEAASACPPDLLAEVDRRLDRAGRLLS